MRSQARLKNSDVHGGFLFGDHVLSVARLAITDEESWQSRRGEDENTIKDQEKNALALHAS